MAQNTAANWRVTPGRNSSSAKIAYRARVAAVFACSWCCAATPRAQILLTRCAARPGEGPMMQRARSTPKNQNPQNAAQVGKKVTATEFVLIDPQARLHTPLAVLSLQQSLMASMKGCAPAIPGPH